MLSKKAAKNLILVAVILMLEVFFVLTAAKVLAIPSNWTQTSQQDFEQAISYEHVDLSSQPGAVRLTSGQFIFPAGSSIRVIGRSGEITWEYNTGLSSPYDAIRLSNGNTLITDSGHHRVFEIDQTNATVWQYGTGSPGSGPNQLFWPTDASRTTANTTLITDTFNYRVIEVDNSTGAIVWQYGTTGSSGSGPNQLDRPWDAIRLSSGNTLITDMGNHRIIEVEPTGSSGGTIVWQYGTTGTSGSGPNQLYFPMDATPTSTGNVLITDTYNHRVVEVEPVGASGGTIVWQYGTGSPGSGFNQLKSPADAIPLSNGNVLVADTGNNRAVEIDYPTYDISWEYLTGGIPDIKELPEPQFVSSGSLLSPVFDTGSYSSWDTISWLKDTPTDTNISFKTRTSEDYESWSSWSAPYTTPGQSITNPEGRFIQYQLNLESTDPSATPSLYEVTIEYEPDTQPPTKVTHFSATPGVSPDIDLSWSSASDNLDVDHYILYRSLSPITETNKDQANIIDYRILSGTTTYTDSTGVPGQTYYYAITAVDKADNVGPLSNSPQATVADGEVPGVPHGSYLQEPDDCAICHLTHTGLAQRQLTEQTEVMVCYTCHDSSGSGSIYTTEADFAKAYHHKIPEATQTCSDCHDPHGDQDSNDKYYSRLLRALDPSGGGGWLYQENAFCGACHGDGTSIPSGDIVTPFASSAHDAYPAIPQSGTEIMCARCHLPHGSDYASLARDNEEYLCYDCHDDNSNQYHESDLSIQQQFTESNSFVIITKKAGADRPPVWLNAHHDVDSLDQSSSGSKLECKNCHSIHETEQKWTDTGSPIINPDTGLVYTQTTTHPAWKITIPDYNQFCEACHDDAMPLDVLNTNLTNIKLYYEDTGSDGNYHGARAGTGYQGNLRAPYGRGMDALPCTDCHDWHGTSNLFHIKEYIKINEDQAGNVGNITLVPVSINSGEDLAQLCVACHKDYGTYDVGNGWSGVPDAAHAGNCLTCHQHELPGWF